MNFLEIIPGKIDVEEVINKVKDPSCGGISVFIGTTRDNFDGLEVKHLFYEAYDKMALKVMSELCHSIREKWPNVLNIAMYHRVGEVKICEESIIICISSPHRKDCIDAVDFAINRFKSIVPIWKKEFYNHGIECSEVGVWKENKECPWTDQSEGNS